jgi:hypothetical protein
MKRLVIALAVGFFFLAAGSCSKKCESEMPRARILNNGTTVASVQIKTADGNTVNINNVDPATASVYASYVSGAITFTITVNKTPYVKATTVSNCFDYDIAIDANNNIVITPKDRNA